MRYPCLLLALAACGDNAAPTFEMENGAGQSAATAVVISGTYTPKVANRTTFARNIVSHELSQDGSVMLELRVRRSDEINVIRMVAFTKANPRLTIVDQVDSEGGELGYSITDGSLDQTGLVDLTLDVPLVVGSRGETLWIRVDASAPVEIFSLDWR